MGKTTYFLAKCVNITRQLALTAAALTCLQLVFTSNLSNFRHAFASRGFVSVSWAFLFGFLAEESQWHIAVSSECCCTSDYWDPEIRAWSVTADRPTCMMTCIGWLCLEGCRTNLPWRPIVVFSTGFQDISPTTVYLYLKFPVASIDLPDVVNCLFHVFATARLEASVTPLCILCHAWPTVWNSLLNDLRDPAVDFKHFMQNLKTRFSHRTLRRRVSALEILTLSRTTNWHLLYFTPNLVANGRGIRLRHRGTRVPLNSQVNK